MTSRYIATRLHQARELAPDEPFFERCSRLPHFVVDPSLVALLVRGDVQGSILAMVEAQIAHLPFPEMLLELEMETIRGFVILTEHHRAFRAAVAMLHPRGAAEVDANEYSLELGENAVRVTEPSRRSHEAWLRFSAFALNIALLMLNIQGIEREIIEPVKLNKQRIHRGLPPVPKHSVMRIGHVYGQNGERLAYGVGRQMPVHLRAGHARRQHYGEGNELTKIVYIPPVLVNFKPGAVVKQPKRVLVA